MSRWAKEEVSITKGELRTLVLLAVRGYNAELKFKTYRRFRGERDSEFAMRKAEELQVIEAAQELIPLQGRVAEAPKEIE